MKKLITKSIIVLAMFVTYSSEAYVSTKYTGSCSALARESGEYPEKKITGYPSTGIFNKMTQANQLLSEGNKVQAYALINEVKDSTDNAFTLSVVYQYLAREAFEKNQFSKTVEYAQRVIDLDALPVNTLLQMKKQVVWAYLSNNDFKSAISWMKQYFSQVINPPVSDYKALAQLYYQDKDYKNAICPIYLALKKTTKLKDKESLYKMLFSSHFTLNDLSGSAKILSEMINFYPNKKDYWNQLYSIHYQMRDLESALAVNELAYRKGIWTKESEIKNLAAMHYNVGSPLRGAERIEQGIKSGVVPRTEENLKLVASYLDRAKERERAVQAFKEVSKVSSKGTYAYRIGNIYFDSEDYKNAIKYFTEAVNKGGLKELEKGNAYLQLGGAQFYLGNETAAINELQKAKLISRVSKNAASWIGFIKEKQRIRELLRKDAEALEAEVAAEKAESEEKNN